MDEKSRLICILSENGLILKFLDEYCLDGLCNASEKQLREFLSERDIKYPEK